MTIYRNCNGITRRNVIQLGLNGFMGMGMAQGLLRRALAGDSGAAPKMEAKSCILIWLDGGPSHYETFDPKPLAPREVRGEFDPISTKVTGIFFSQHLTRLASIANKLAVVRSICHNQTIHGGGNHYMITGAPPRVPVGCGAYVSFHPSLGSVTAHTRGNKDGLPAYFSIPSMTRSGGPSFLGAQYAPFVVPDDPNQSSFRVRDVALPSGITDERFVRRENIRSRVDRLQRINAAAAADPVRVLDEYHEQSKHLMQSQQAQAAFALNKEPDTVRDRYGRNTFGQRALLARRLVEAGVPFITLNEGGWDHHRQIFKALNERLPQIDNTVATLIEDLNERGLLDSTLVLLLGEFGRTPKVNVDAGRDHWSQSMSVMLAGAQIPGGQIIGATDRAGYNAVDRVLSPENFVSSVYKKLGILPDKVLYTPQGRPTHLVSDPTPISELFA